MSCWAVKGGETKMMNRDPELPNGLQDGDFELAEIEAQARREVRIRKAGLCTHGWRQRRPDGTVECLHCHKVSTYEALDQERREALI